MQTIYLNTQTFGATCPLWQSPSLSKSASFAKTLSACKWLYNSTENPIIWLNYLIERPNEAKKQFNRLVEHQNESKKPFNCLIK